MENINIFIVDDHKLFVEGISALLTDDKRFHLIGSANSAAELYQKMTNLPIDVFLVDVNIPEVSGVEITKKIKEVDHKAKVLALTMYDDYEYVEKMIKSGADGYILKSSSIFELSSAIENIAKGNRFFGKEIQEILFNKIENKNNFENQERNHENNQYNLTKREKEILILIAKEYTSQQIATKLFISERTVETHRKNIFSKTQAKSVIGLTKYAFKIGLINLK